MVALCFSIASATDYNDTAPFANENRNSRWIIRAGLSVNTVTGGTVKFIKNTTGARFHASFGYDISATFNQPLSNKGWFWGVQIGMSTRGWRLVSAKETFELPTGSICVAQTKGHLRAYSFRWLPWIAGYRHAINKNTSFEMHISPYFTYDFTGSDRGVSYIGIKNPGSTKWDKEDSSKQKEDLDHVSGMDAAHEYQRFDIGLDVGVGIWYRQFNFDLSFEQGFIPIFKHENLYSSKAFIRLGYAF